jgi:hypothetical protein
VVRRVPHDLDVVVSPWHLLRSDALVDDLGYRYVGPIEVHDPGTERERRCRKMLRDLGDGRHLTLDVISESGPFAGVIGRARSVWTAEGPALNAMHPDDLVRTKRLAGRDVDLTDLWELEALLRLASKRA